MVVKITKHEKEELDIQDKKSKLEVQENTLVNCAQKRELFTFFFQQFSFLRFFMTPRRPGWLPHEWHDHQPATLLGHAGSTRSCEQAVPHGTQRGAGAV